MAEPLADWENREFVPSTLPNRGELTSREPAGALPPSLPGMSNDNDESGYNDLRSSNPRLNFAAEKVGSALGSTVGNVRSRLRIVGGRSAKMASLGTSEISEQASQRASEIADFASEKFSSLKESAASRASEWKEIAGERVAKWQTFANSQVNLTRRRASYYSHEYPVQTMLSLAGFAFVMGCGLRIWRANSD